MKPQHWLSGLVDIRPCCGLDPKRSATRCTFLCFSSSLPSSSRQALKEMACLAIQSSGTVPAAELGSEDTVRSVLETRLVVRTGRVLRFALPVEEQYFAAQAVLEQGTTRLDLHDLRLLERWRYPIMLAVTIGSWRQVTALLDALTHLHTGLSSWSVANALPETASAPT